MCSSDLKGYACRPRNAAWKAEAKRFQHVLNVAATKLPGPKEYPKLIKVDGRIGLKTQTLFQKTIPRIPGSRFVNFRKDAAIANKPENISANMEYFTEQLETFTSKVKGKAKSKISGSPKSSPIPGVDSGQWADFVLCMKGRGDRKSTRLNSSHIPLSRMPSSA